MFFAGTTHQSAASFPYACQALPYTPPPILAEDQRLLQHYETMGAGRTNYIFSDKYFGVVPHISLSLIA